MSSTLRILGENYIDDATLTVTAGSVDADLPIENLQVYSNSEVCRVITPGTVTIKIDFPVAQMVSGFVLDGHSLSVGADWSLRILDGVDLAGNETLPANVRPALEEIIIDDMTMGVNSFSDSVFTGWGLAHTYMWFSPVVMRSAELIIRDPNNSTGYFDIRRLRMGLTLSPIVNFDQGIKIQWEDETKQKRSAGTTLWSNPKQSFRKQKFKLAEISHDEFSQWLDFTRKVGKRLDIFVTAFSNQGGKLERDFAMTCKFSSLPIFERFDKRSTAEFELVGA